MTPQYIKIDEDGNMFYYKDKQMTIFHREDGFAVECVDNRKEWYLNGKLHREDGPAVEYPNGCKAWFLNNELHREDGPAIERPNGTKDWYLNGHLHREDGPAIEYADGSKEWCFEGKGYSKEEFLRLTAKEIVLTMDEIADKLGVDVSKLKIAK